MHFRHVLALSALSALAAAPLAAQAYNNPAFQTPRIVDREYNFAVSSSGNAGTSLFVQWREGINDDWQFSLDGGVASPKGIGNTRVLLAGGLAWQWLRATDDMPFDIAATGSLGFSSGGGRTVVRVPFGIVAGHTFAFDNGMSITPYVHPRLSIDDCSNCSLALGETAKLDVDADLGASFTITQQVAVRLAVLVGGSSYLGSTNAIAFSVAWTPKGLKKF